MMVVFMNIARGRGFIPGPSERHTSQPLNLHSNFPKNQMYAFFQDFNIAMVLLSKREFSRIALTLVNPWFYFLKKCKEIREHSVIIKRLLWNSFPRTVNEEMTKISVMFLLIALMSSDKQTKQTKVSFCLDNIIISQLINTFLIIC